VDDVLLIDADIAKPGVLETLGLENGPGLMDALADPAPPAPPIIETHAAPRTAAHQMPPIMRLVRALPAAASPAPPTVAQAEVATVQSRKGVCAAYYVSRKCWEVPDAYCNQALHVCMLRECPVYHLNRGQLEERFARKFAHLW
jgi:hypothetical protein